MADASVVETSGGQRKVRIHPLAITSICDHHTRVHVGGTQQPSQDTIGLLFGIQEGLSVSIYDATETVYRIEDGKIVLDSAQILKKKELFVAVYPQYELLGWYTVSSQVQQSDLLIHRQMFAFNESPLCVVMNPSPSPQDRSLPVSIFEAQVHLLGDTQQPTMLFVGMAFGLETSQAEQISVEEVAKSTPTDAQSALDKHAVGLRTSLRTLGDRVATVVAYLNAVKAGQIPVDYGMLRRVGKLSHELSAIDSSSFDHSFENEMTDAMMITYLAAATKTSHALTSVSDKYTLAFGDRVGRRGGF